MFPLAPLAEGLHRALVGADAKLRVSNLLVLAAWAGVGWIVAVRRFYRVPQTGI